MESKLKERNEDMGTEVRESEKMVASKVIEHNRVKELLELCD